MSSPLFISINLTFFSLAVLGFTQWECWSITSYYGILIIPSSVLLHHHFCGQRSIILMLATFFLGSRRENALIIKYNQLLWDHNAPFCCIIICEQDGALMDGVSLLDAPHPPWTSHEASFIMWLYCLSDNAVEKDKVKQAGECCRKILNHVNQAVKESEDKQVR